MITLKDVSKSYTEGAPALSDINIQIDEGEFVFVVGDSGSGKSTLIKLLLKELEPTSGTIVINDKILSQIPRRQIPRFRRNVGCVFQDFRLLKDRNVYENVAFAQRVISAPNRAIKEKVPKMLSLVGLAAKYKSKPNQLSGGEQQRVAIARALINEPKILLADEPTGNLDSNNAWEIMKLLDEINKRGTTVLVVSHNMEIVEEEINTYVEKILLELRGNTREELEEYTILLNNSKLNIKLKDKLIQQIETIVDDISTITGLDEAHLLFQYSKVRPTWGNVQTMFANDEDSLSPSVITFLNQGNNAIALARNKMTTDKDEDGVEIYSKLCKALMHENSINDRSYKLLVSSIPWCYNSFDSNSISYERMKVLIENNKVNKVVAGYDFLRQNYKGLNIQLIEKAPDKFIEILDQLEVDTSDIDRKSVV